MTPAEIARLESLAREATPGEWHADPVRYPHTVGDPDANRIVETYGKNRTANAAYIAAAYPAAVLALIAMWQAAEEKLSIANEIAVRWQDIARSSEAEAHRKFEDLREEHNRLQQWVIDTAAKLESNNYFCLTSTTPPETPASPASTASKPSPAGPEIPASASIPKEPPRCQSHQPAGTDPK